MARCMKPAVWTEMLWWQLLKIWLHEILVKLCYSQWSFEHGRVYSVFICIKIYCKELKFPSPERKWLEQYLSTAAALSLQVIWYSGTQVILIFYSTREYRSEYNLLWVWHHWFGWDFQGRILSEKQQGLKILHRFSLGSFLHGDCWQWPLHQAGSIKRLQQLWPRRCLLPSQNRTSTS